MDPQMEQAIRCYLELTQMAAAALGLDNSTKLAARPTEEDNVDVFIEKQSGDILIDFDCLHLTGMINGKEQLATLEGIFYSWPDIDCEYLSKEITARLNKE